ncbi:MAG: ABC transporter permease subunit [Deltaproteobacteria bacterium]|nr:ABC transporter permease subunit [Deltaproteobacteria bacterium]
MAVALVPLPALADEPAGQLAEKTDTLAEVRAHKELRWGNDSQGGAPYVFQDPMDPNHLIGFEVDLADALAKKLGARARPIQGQWDKLLELLARGDFDVALNGIEVADEKKRVALLSRPYYAAEERLTVRRGDEKAPRTLEALAGRKVGTLPGSLAERILKRAGADVRTYDGGQNEIYDDLRLGRTDAVLLDFPITRFYGEIEPELEVVPGALGAVQYAIALKSGDEAMKAEVDHALEALAQDGTLADIYGRWGLWNEETSKLFGGMQAPSALPEQYDAWRAAVGKNPPFWQRVRERYPKMMGLFLQGAALTLVVSLLAMALAVALGVTLALLRTYGPKPLQFLAVAYIEFFRGTPLLIQLTMIYFGLPELGVKLNPFVAGWLALGLNYASAEAENYRAGLASVPAGQLDAARTLGLTKMQALRHVVAPQAFRVAIPPATNDFIALLKDSSLVSVVTLTELTKTYENLASATRDHLGLGAVVAVWYLLMSLPFARLSRWVELRLGRHLRRAV